MRSAITDEIWAVMGPMVDRCESRLGPEPQLPDRMFLEAVLYWARTGVPWRDLPGDFGDWSAVYKPPATLDRLGTAQEALRDDCRPARLRGHGEGHDRLDHRAGPSALRGGVQKKGGAAAQAIGRSRGGPSTKIIAVVDEDGLIALDIAEGQRNDAPLALPVLAQAKAAVGRIDEVLGDKGFDSDEIRGACLEEHDALPVIPNRANRKEPWPWDEVMKET